MCLPRDVNISGPGVGRHEVKGSNDSQSLGRESLPGDLHGMIMWRRERERERGTGIRVDVVHDVTLMYEVLHISYLSVCSGLVLVLLLILSCLPVYPLFYFHFFNYIYHSLWLYSCCNMEKQGEDDAQLAALGHRAELNRNFSTL